MTFLARAALAVALLSAVLVGLPQPASATVVFAPGEGTAEISGRTMCIIGTGRGGAGTVTCASPAVNDAVWAGAPCDEVGKFGCVYQGRLRAVRIRDKGAPKRAWIEGAGGSLSVRPGERFKAGDITGRRLSDNGFTAVNASGRGFTLANQSYAVR